MKNYGVLLAGMTMVIAAPASAQSVFDGTWRVDIASAKLPEKPTTTTLVNGVYRCVTCNTPYSVKADGAFHAVAGQDYADEISVRIVDARTTESRFRKAGKPVGTLTSTVSADGTTMRYVDTDLSLPTGVPAVYEGTQVRVAKGPAGSHAISGAWKPGKVTSISDAAMTMTMTSKGDVLTFAMPTGMTYTATFGGPFVPLVGDVGGTTVAVQKTGPRTIVERDMRGGKLVSMMTMTVSPDGKSQAITSQDLIRKTTAQYTAYRQ